MEDHTLTKHTKLIKQITDNTLTEKNTPTNKLFGDLYSFVRQELKMNKMNKEYSLLMMSIVDSMGYKQVMQERELRRQRIQDKWDARCLSRRLRSELNNSGVTCVKTSHPKL